MDKYMLLLARYPAQWLVILMGLLMNVLVILFWRRLSARFSIWRRLLSLAMGFMAMFVGFTNMVVKLTEIKP